MKSIYVVEDDANIGQKGLSAPRIFSGQWKKSRRLLCCST